MSPEGIDRVRRQPWRTALPAFPGALSSITSQALQVFIVAAKSMHLVFDAFLCDKTDFTQTRLMNIS